MAFLSVSRSVPGPQHILAMPLEDPVRLQRPVHMRLRLHRHPPPRALDVAEVRLAEEAPLDQRLQGKSRRLPLLPPRTAPSSFERDSVRRPSPRVTWRRLAALSEGRQSGQRRARHRSTTSASSPPRPRLDSAARAPGTEPPRRQQHIDRGMPAQWKTISDSVGTDLRREADVCEPCARVRGGWPDRSSQELVEGDGECGARHSRGGL